MNTANSENVDNIYQENYEAAEKMMQHPNKIEKLLKRLEKKLRDLPILNDALTCIPKMGMLIHSWLKREYTQVPIGTIAAIIGVLIYFVAPIDLIADFIPGIGLLDDASVAAGALALVNRDLEEYLDWRLENDLDEASPIE